MTFEIREASWSAPSPLALFHLPGKSDKVMAMGFLAVFGGMAIEKAPEETIIVESTALLPFKLCQKRHRNFYLNDRISDRLTTLNGRFVRRYREAFDIKKLTNLTNNA